MLSEETPSTGTPPGVSGDTSYASSIPEHVHQCRTCLSVMPEPSVTSSPVSGNPKKTNDTSNGNKGLSTDQNNSQVIVKEDPGSLSGWEKRWRELTSDHEFDYVNDGAAFIKAKLSQQKKQIREGLDSLPEYNLDVLCVPKEDVLKLLED